MDRLKFLFGQRLAGADMGPQHAYWANITPTDAALLEHVKLVAELASDGLKDTAICLKRYCLVVVFSTLPDLISAGSMLQTGLQFMYRCAADDIYDKTAFLRAPENLKMITEVARNLKIAPETITVGDAEFFRISLANVPVSVYGVLSKTWKARLRTVLSFPERKSHKEGNLEVAVSAAVVRMVPPLENEKRKPLCWKAVSL